MNVANLDQLEQCIARLRKVDPMDDQAMALDSLAFVAGGVMDDAAREWERLVGHPWERYVD